MGPSRNKVFLAIEVWWSQIGSVLAIQRVSFVQFGCLVVGVSLLV